MAYCYNKKRRRSPGVNLTGYVEGRRYENCTRRPTGERALVGDRLAAGKGLYHKDLVGHFGCVNATEFAHGIEDNPAWLISGGDDRRVLAWNINQNLYKNPTPVCMQAQHNSSIFCLSFDVGNEKIFSGGNDEQVIYHDFSTQKTLDVFPHDDVVYGLSVDPNNKNVFASASEDGRVRIYDVREPASSDPFCLASYRSSMLAVMYNPVDPRLIFTANSVCGVELRDIRQPRKCLVKYRGDFCANQDLNCMSVRVNSTGTQLIALFRRLPLVMLYNIDNPTPIAKFSSSTDNYSNLCTMKSCSFAGDKDEYVLSGSDSFHVFMWSIPETDTLSTTKSVQLHAETPHMVLKSHRSIVNQVRYCKTNHLLASSGVEKIIKIWSPFPIAGGDGELMKETKPSKPERVRFTQEQYVDIMLRPDMIHDYIDGNMEEDTHMVAFFDSLIQAGGDPWSSDEDPVVVYDHTNVFGLNPPLSDSSSSASEQTDSPILSFISSSSDDTANTSSILDSSTLSDRASTVLSTAAIPGTFRSEISSSEALLTATVPNSDTPYRARARTAVKRMRRLRQRVENSDTSDSDDPDTMLSDPKVLKETVSEDLTLYNHNCSLSNNNVHSLENLVANTRGGLDISINDTVEHVHVSENNNIASTSKGTSISQPQAMNSFGGRSITNNASGSKSEMHLDKSSGDSKSLHNGKSLDNSIWERNSSQSETRLNNNSIESKTPNDVKSCDNRACESKSSQNEKRLNNNVCNSKCPKPLNGLTADFLRSETKGEVPNLLNSNCSGDFSASSSTKSVFERTVDDIMVSPCDNNTLASENTTNSNFKCYKKANKKRHYRQQKSDDASENEDS